MPVLRGFTLKTPNARSSMRCAAAQGAFQRFEDGFHGLFGFGATDVGLAYHGVYDIELDHTGLRRSRGPMLLGAAQVVKTCSPRNKTLYLFKSTTLSKSV